MTDIDNLIERLRGYASFTRPGIPTLTERMCAEAADALNVYLKATGGLPPELVAKALAYSWGRTPVGMSAAELDALRAATFEAPT